jgi:alpha-ketoglutaric semialdehyde dehydrogenase
MSTTPITGKNHISAKWSARGVKTFRAFDPGANQFLKEEFFLATEEEMEEMMIAAEQAFVSYREKTDAEKALFLETIATEIMALGDALIERCVMETGLPAARITGERARTVGQLRLFAEVLRQGHYVQARIDKADAERKPVPKPDLRRMMIPLGPVLVFGASNFPLAFSTAGGDTASALAAGCPVVVKAHSSHPGANELISQAIGVAVKKSGMPEGVFSMFYASRDLGIKAVEHPVIKAVGFTGSRQAGMSIFKAAVSRAVPIPVYAEMSAVNPVIILPGALEERLESIAEGLVASITLGTGQFCTNPGIVFIKKGTHTEKFIDRLTALMQGANPGTMLNSNICKTYKESVESLKNIPGVVEAAASEKAADPEKNEGQPRLFIVPAARFMQEERLREEVFGPSSQLVLCDTVAEIMSALSLMEGQLTASIHSGSRELSIVRQFLPVMTRLAGRVLMNGFPTGVEVCAAQQHGGPFPASSDSRVTSVGTAAMERFQRPVAFQGFPEELLPDHLKESNPLNIVRIVDNKYVLG